MAILLPHGLPAAQALHTRRPAGGVPLEVVLVNLMPLKQATEIQFARLLHHDRHDVRLRLVTPPGHTARHTEPGHIARFYTPWAEVCRRPVDGLIVTGAPVEHLAFAEVDYWPWFRTLCDWAAASAGHSLFICWAAQAMLFHRHGIAKRSLPCKAFGVYAQDVLDRRHPLMAGLPPVLPIPVSRHTTVDATEVAARPGLSTVAASPCSGPAIVDDPARRTTAMFNHIEYDVRTLHDEYFRDRAAGRLVPLPHDYYRNGVLIPPQRASWAEAARRLFGNWLDLLAANRSARAAA